MADTVLLVDYDPRNIAKVRSWLTAAGLEVRLALDGEAALQAFRENRPTLVLLHDLLPKRHGFEVCREIKKIAEDAPVVLMADGRNGRRYEVLDTGCDEFVQKPVAETDLIAAVRPHVAIVEATARAAPAVDDSPSEAAPAAPRFVLPDEVGEIGEDDIDATLDALLNLGGAETGTDVANAATASAPTTTAANAASEPAEAAKCEPQARRARSTKKKTTKKKVAKKKTTKKKASSRRSPAKKTAKKAPATGARATAKSESESAGSKPAASTRKRRSTRRSRRSTATAPAAV